MAVWVRTGLEGCRKLGIGGILCLESASGYNGLSTFDFLSFPQFFYRTIQNKVVYIDGDVSYIGIPEDLSYEHTVDIGDGIFVTDKERTICDMIKYDCDLFHLLESIDYYYTYEDDVTPLENLAKEYGIFERLQELKKESENIYNEY